MIESAGDGAASTRRLVRAEEASPSVSPRIRPLILATAPNPVGLLLALKRRWLLAITLGLFAGALGAVGMWFAQKTTFTARTVINISARPPSLMFAHEGGDFANYQRNQIALIKSRLVLLSALRNPKVSALSTVQEQTDAVAWLEREIQADFSIAPEMLRIAMVGENSSELVVIVDALREAYVKEILYKEKGDEGNALSKLRELQADFDQKLKNSRKNYESIANGLSSKDPKTLELMHEFNLKSLHSVESDLLMVQHELLKDKMELSLEPAQDAKLAAGSVPRATLEDQLNREPAVARLLKSNFVLEEEIAELHSSRPDLETDNYVKNRKGHLETNKKEIERLKKELEPKVTTKLVDQLKLEFKRHFDAVRQQITTLKEAETYFKKEVDARTESLEKFKKDQIKAEWLSDDIAQYDAMYKKLSAKITEMQIEEQAPPRFRMAQEAIATQDTDTRLKKAGLAGAGVFALIVFGIALVEFRLRRVTTVDDVLRGLQINVMGTVPTIAHGARQQVAMAPDAAEFDRQGVLAESIDAARTMLLHMAQQEFHKVVMVTSADGGEGKTFLVSHLAVSLARAGFRTLLVDCDLRQPAVHKMFELNGQPGVCDVLRGQTTAAAAIQAGPVEGLSVMTAGKTDGVAFKALAQRRSRDMFKSLKEQFDFILVDSAPILPVADSLQVCQCVDGVILSILRNVSRLPAVYAAYERLAALKVHVLGAVVNGVDADYYRVNYADPTAVAENVTSPEPEDADQPTENEVSGAN